MDSRRTQNLDLIEIKLGREYYHQYLDITSWCERQFGLGDWGDPAKGSSWGSETSFGYTHLYFRNEKDALLFCLKWM